MTWVVAYFKRLDLQHFALLQKVIHDFYDSACYDSAGFCSKVFNPMALLLCLFGNIKPYVCLERVLCNV